MPEVKISWEPRLGKIEPFIREEDARLVAPDDMPPGAAHLAAYGADPETRELSFVCPCGCHDIVTIPIKTGEKRGFVWEWDGNDTAPTVKPSIRRLGGCKWHGWLTAGVFSGDREP